MTLTIIEKPKAHHKTMTIGGMHIYVKVEYFVVCRDEINISLQDGTKHAHQLKDIKEITYR